MLPFRNHAQGMKRHFIEIRFYYNRLVHFCKHHFPFAQNPGCSFTPRFPLRSVLLSPNSEKPPIKNRRLRLSKKGFALF